MLVRWVRRLAAATLAALCLASSALAAEDGYSECYTYTYDYWVEYRESPDAYRVKTVLNSASLGLDTHIKLPESIYVRGDDLYLCDTGNNRLLHLRRDGGGYSLVRIIDRCVGAEPETFNTPMDVFVDEQGQIFLCDMNNNRILKMDANANYLMEFGKPSDETFDQSLSYLPMKLVVDVTGRVFALAKNVNKGLIKYERDGAFTGFIGANKVRYNFIDYIWKLMSTKQQRAQQESFVPTEYDNIYMDREGFIFAVTTTYDVGHLMDGQANPIRRLNAIGNDILIKNDHYPPIGDLDWDDAADVTGPSKLNDITVLDNDVYIALDRVRGRLFGYDSQGIMLWAFGGVGNSDGRFLMPVAIDHMGYDLLVLDKTECSVTVFTPTEYGALIYGASEAYTRGDYDKSADYWQDVLALNANNALAHIGIGRAQLRAEQYKDAMDNFSLARDAKNYADAFRLYRKEWVEHNIGWLFGGILALLLIPLAIGKIRKIRAEVNQS